MALRGRVAWVLGGDGALGRAVALEMAGRGASVFVTGKVERELGRTVGEIAYQGGKARHLVVDSLDADARTAAARHVVSVFGSVDLIIGPAPSVELVAAAATAALAKSVAVSALPTCADEEADDVARAFAVALDASLG